MEHKTLFDTIKVKEEEDGESRYVTCEECDTHVDCYNDNINIVYKGGDSVNNPHEDLVLCTMCFQDMKHELIQQGYKCDDWDIDEEEEEEEDEETDEFKCPTCNLVQSNNWCFSCDTNNSCQYCVGIGGNDATEGHREWVCQKCFDKQPEIKDETYEYEYEAGEEEEEETFDEEELKEYLKEMEIDRISNGECPTISHESYLSRLTSEQREVEKENDRLWKIRLKEISIQHEKQAKQDEEDDLRALKIEKMQEAFPVLITHEDRKKEKESGEEEVEEASLSDANLQQGKHSNTDLVQLCVNMDCERYPPDWDSEEDTEETYQEDQWKKCCLCDGYFNDDGMGDILYVQEEPNNQEAECSLCGKSDDVVQMKGCGQYLCGNACDESDESDEEED
jgi:hypothetical protein